jgi:RNA recognition motif-containing protein
MQHHAGANPVLGQPQHPQQGMQPQQQQQGGVQQVGGANGSEPEPLRNLMVNYIPTTIDEPQLRQIFEMYGPTESVKIVNDRETRTSKGYGFVKYRYAFSAAHAIQYLNGYPLLNKRLKVAYANQAEAQRALAQHSGDGGAAAAAAAAAGLYGQAGPYGAQAQPQVDAAAQMQYMQQLAALQLLQQGGAQAQQRSGFQ